jgi:AraC family transcriptional regulator
MREHVQDHVQLADLARQAQVSPFHFARLFKAATNESPHAFLVRLRVECARELLASDAHLTTATVAYACGFSDQGHLARQFRKLIGYSPAQYRRQLGLSSLRSSANARLSSRPLFAS